MNNLRIDWDNLRIFLAVARSQSALEAAGQLELDHSTVTRRLHRLEKEIGSKLFDRTTQGHRLTPTGDRLLEAVERIDNALSTVDAEIGGDSQVLTGQVRLGATEGFGSFFLAPHLADFCARHPGITVDLLPVPRFVNLSKREADLAVSIERPESGAYVVCKLADYRLQLYATRHYLDRNPTISTLSDLQMHRFIGYVDELTFSTELRYLSKLAPGAAVKLRSTSIVAQFFAARQGHALAVLPSFIGNTSPDLIPVLPRTVEVVRSFWLIAPSERREIARVRALWDFLRERADRNRAYLMGETDSIVWS
ncbi:LysR family transcriptional regulator [Azospira restricta]|uniref:LysR family transcriptional regulator n=1 Tax=Azospira restricta TaxID=404405 RepID=A0A974PXV2_9RHOO|nr:LysR family transcriptional regulator [Azospira restricta]QRJ63494.1 LysR family transcriptional regulator [Azospira restricta]